VNLPVNHYCYSDGVRVLASAQSADEAFDEAVLINIHLSISLQVLRISYMNKYSPLSPFSIQIRTAHQKLEELLVSN
jgi:hypothetical protein